jgi:hypothetical protein
VQGRKMNFSCGQQLATEHAGGSFPVAGGYAYQNTTSTPKANQGKFGAVAEGDLYQPETRPEPVKKGGVLDQIFRI